MALPVSFRWDEEFVARIDKARGDVPRSVWVRRAIEQELGADALGQTLSVPMVETSGGWQPPAVQTRRHGNVGPKRDVRPIPKRGKS